MFTKISRLDRLSLWGAGLKAGLAAMAAAVMFSTLSPATAQQPTEAPPAAEARAKALTTPDRLDRQRARLMERLAEFDRRAAATRTFYAQLSPSQKKAFDALPQPGGKHREIRIERRMLDPGPGGHAKDHDPSK
jgi:hypothetical protein